MSEPTDEAPLQPPQVLGDMLLGSAVREVLIHLLMKTLPTEALDGDAIDAMANAAAVRERQATAPPDPDAPLGERYAVAILEKIAAIYADASGRSTEIQQGGAGRLRH